MKVLYGVGKGKSTVTQKGEKMVVDMSVSEWRERKSDNIWRRDAAQHTLNVSQAFILRNLHFGLYRLIDLERCSGPQLDIENDIPRQRIEGSWLYLLRLQILSVTYENAKHAKRVPMKELGSSCQWGHAVGWMCKLSAYARQNGNIQWQSSLLRHSSAMRSVIWEHGGQWNGAITNSS